MRSEHSWPLVFLRIRPERADKRSVADSVEELEAISLFLHKLAPIPMQHYQYAFTHCYRELQDQSETFAWLTTQDVAISLQLGGEFGENGQ